MNVKEVAIYLLWVLFLIFYIPDLFGIGRNVGFILIVAAIILSNMLIDPKKKKLLSWISLGIFIISVLFLFLGFMLTL